MTASLSECFDLTDKQHSQTLSREPATWISTEGPEDNFGDHYIRLAKKTERLKGQILLNAYVLTMLTLMLTLALNLAIHVDLVPGSCWPGIKTIFVFLPL